MPKGQHLIPHLKITNTSSGKVIILDGDEAKSVINQIDRLTVENRNKEYIRYQDPATKSQVVLELCCVEIERLPNTVEEFDARECELDCCEQQFFGTFKTSVNQQTGEFPKKSQPSVPDKKKDDSSTPNKPSVDTPTKPSENNGNSGSTNPTTPSENTGNTTPSQPSENTGTDNGNVSPSTPSENGGGTDNGNSGNTDSGNTTPTQPSDNGNTDNTDTGTTQPTEEPTVFNHLYIEDEDNGEALLFDFTIRGKVGETVILGDEIKKYFNTGSINDGTLNSDGNFEKNGIVYVSDKIQPNLRDYIYTIKENGHDEEIPLVRVKPSTTFH